MKEISRVTRYSTIFPSSTFALMSFTRRPDMPLSVFAALLKPTITASSKLFGDPAITSVTRATLPSITFVYLPVGFVGSLG